MRDRLIAVLMLGVILMMSSSVLPKNKSKLTVRPGLMIPFKESFRNSSGTLFTSGLGFAKYQSNRINMFHELYHINASPNNLSKSLNLLAVSSGWQYHFKDVNVNKVIPYIGAGLTVHFVFFSGELTVTDEEGNAIDYRSEFTSYFGIGVDINMGFDYRLSRRFLTGLQVKTNPSYVQKVDTGGLGNIGGVSFLLNLSLLM